MKGCVFVPHGKLLLSLENPFSKKHSQHSVPPHDGIVPHPHRHFPVSPISPSHRPAPLWDE